MSAFAAFLLGVSICVLGVALAAYLVDVPLAWIGIVLAVVAVAMVIALRRRALARRAQAPQR